MAFALATKPDAGLCMVAGAGISAANKSEQVVFSKTGAFSTGFNPSFGTPLGFWVWCEAESAARAAFMLVRTGG